MADEPLTLSYKTCTNGNKIHLDLYSPDASSVTSDSGIVVYFHGGGLTVGNRKSWFPDWLFTRVKKAGHFFLSPDYRLIPSGGVTGHEVLEDIRDLFDFIRSDERFKEALRSTNDIEVDINRVVLAGSSAGGTCAYLAASNLKELSLRPRAIVSLYGMGGDYLIPHYLSPKTTPFFRGTPLLDPKDPKFDELLYPHPNISSQGKQVSESLTEYASPTAPIPGYSTNPRLLLGLLYLQLGCFLDYYTGEHEPSLSATLRSLKPQEYIEVDLLSRHSKLFPSMNITSSWPPTLFVHGSEDSAVPVAESQKLHGLLQKVDGQSELVVVEGKEHSFDYEEDAGIEHEALFDEIVKFLDEKLRGK